LTSNVGTREMSAVLEHSPVGFHTIEGPPPERSLDFEKTARSAAREVFPLEFLNRLDEILVYSPLDRHHIERIFDKFLADIHVRAMNQAGVPLLIRVSPEARALVLDRGTDLVFGARPLRRAMEAELVDPLSRLIALHRVGPGDIVEVEREGDRLLFYRRESPDTGVVA
jgi:ATP-dependent Clp protease ATP-binding subunit ClpC